LSSDTGKKPRADALRNRSTLIQVARAAFAAGTVWLGGVAREAGVGIGML